MVNKGKGVEKTPMTFEVMNEHSNIKMKIRELSKKLESSDLSEKEIKELRDEISSLTTKVENMENFYDVTKMDLVDVERMTVKLGSKIEEERFIEDEEIKEPKEVETKTEQTLKEEKEDDLRRDKRWNEKLDKTLEKTDLSGDSFLQELFEKRKNK